jgi:hypothetical protein
MERDQIDLSDTTAVHNIPQWLYSHIPAIKVLSSSQKEFLSILLLKQIK